MIDAYKIYNDFLKTSNILVIGDIIYDNYLFGTANRLSPEAPVPIFQLNKEEFRLGAAANVFHNIISLGANAQLCSVTGGDVEGAAITQRINDLKNSYIFKDSTRSTTKKTRLMVGNHHLIRIDREDTHDISDEIEMEAFSIINNNIDLYNMLVISDYNKGFLKSSFVRKVIDLFIKYNKLVIADPKNNFHRYEGVYILKPNIHELIDFVGDCRIVDDFELLTYHCKSILHKIKSNYLYVTMGDKGGVLFGDSDIVHMIPPYGAKAVDITGAGDATLAALAIALSAKANIVEAANFASYVAGICVSKIGTSVVEKSEIFSFYGNENRQIIPLR